MARLRNRIRKADYFSDGDLLRWPRDKRATYSGLYALAEDSGCLEDDCFNWKLLLWPSPLDADITVELLEQWRDELVAAGKLVPYELRGVRYFFLRAFHKHEHPRNPQEPTLPLPPWVQWVKNDSDARKGHYEVDTQAIPDPHDSPSGVVQASYNEATTPPALPCPALSCPDQPQEHGDRGVVVDEEAPVDNPSPEPEERGGSDDQDRSPDLPEVPVSLCGPVARIVGVKAVDRLLERGTDLNVAAARLLARVDEFAGHQFAELPPSKRAEAAEACRREAFERMARHHAREGIHNLPAYMNAATARASHLGDLVGDELVNQLRQTKKTKRKAEPRRIGEVLTGGLTCST